MTKTALLLLILVAACVGSFYGGFRVGELNGRVEEAARDTDPLLNLLLVQAGMEKELVDMNRGRLYGNLDFFDELRSSRLVTPANKNLLEQNILLARDYWQAAGGKILQTEEEAKQMRQTVEEIQSATGVRMGMTFNGMQVSPFFFEEKDRRVTELFDRYSGRMSMLHDMIVEMVEKAKNQPNKTAQSTTTAVTPAAGQSSRQP